MKITTAFAVVLFLPLLAVAAEDYSTPYGEWRGQAQFHARVGDKQDPKAHTVTGLAIAIEPEGKLTGASPENGCRALGIATPSGTATVANLDITLSGCQHDGYNRRYSGNLFLYPAQGHASLRLRSYLVSSDTRTPGYDIRATLKRRGG